MKAHEAEVAAQDLLDAARCAAEYKVRQYVNANQYQRLA